MSEEFIEGAVQKGFGWIKEVAGKALHDDKLVAEGLADRGAGASQEVAGKTKDTINWRPSSS